MTGVIWEQVMSLPFLAERCRTKDLLWGEAVLTPVSCDWLEEGQRMMKYSSVEIDSTADKTLIRFEMKLVEHVEMWNMRRVLHLPMSVEMQVLDAEPETLQVLLYKLLWIGILHFGRLSYDVRFRVQYIETHSRVSQCIGLRRYLCLRFCEL